MILISALIMSPKSSATSYPIMSDAGTHFGFFYSSLASHGEWIEVQSGIRVWRPFHVVPQWRPYLLGRWVWTDDGWYWLSNEPFGWITYHYGRWYNDEYYGWIWIPDNVWAPAWVEWRYDDDYIGWAPLPPYATFHWTLGLRFTTEWIAPVHYWNFIRYHRFGTVIRYHDVVPVEYARHLMRTCHISWEYGIEHDRIINRGIDRAIIEHRGKIHFEKTELRAIREQAGERVMRSSGNHRGGVIEFYRPTNEEFQQGTDHLNARRGERTVSLDMSRIDKPQSESFPRTETQSSRNETIREQSQHQPPGRADVQQERYSRERTPRFQQRPAQTDKKQLREELIQRHELKTRPAPPSLREHPQQRLERGRQNSPKLYLDKSHHETQKDNKDHRRN
jgi:hypothetical protein